MHLRPYHKFRHNGSPFLFNIEEMKAFHIDEATLKALESISSDPNLPVAPEINKELKRLELTLTDDKVPRRRTDSNPEPVPIRNISLFVTQDCNLRCTYCYGDRAGYSSAGHMERESAIKAVDWLIAQSGKVKNLHISFFGGEPLLNFPLMKEVVTYAKDRAKEAGKEFEFDITTNLSLLDEEKLTFLKKQGVKPLVSFDGPKEIQDIQRPFRNGEGSYDAIVPKITQLLSVMPHTICRATLLGETDPVRVMEALHEIGFSSTHTTVASPSLFDGGRERMRRNFTGMARLVESDAERFLENVKTRNLENLQKQKNCGFLGKFLGQFLINNKRPFSCGAGKNYVAVSSSGDVFLCHRFVGTDDYKLGSIFGGDLETELYQKSALKFSDKCSCCFARYICAGGCYHDNLGTTGSVFDPAEDTCRMMQQIMELLAYISSQLSNEDKAYLTTEKIIPRKPCPLDFP